MYTNCTHIFVCVYVYTNTCVCVLYVNVFVCIHVRVCKNVYAVSVYMLVPNVRCHRVCMCLYLCA